MFSYRHMVMREHFIIYIYIISSYNVSSKKWEKR